MKNVSVFVFMLIVVALTGCIPQKDYEIRVTRPDVMYVGDSACYKVFDVEEENIIDPNDHYRWDKETKSTAQVMTGIVHQCVPKRKLVNFKGDLPKGYRVMFLAMGTNDVAGRVPLDKFREHYQRLVDSSDAEILNCVLPNTIVYGISSEPYRDVIRSICSNVIDPRDFGVRFRAKDTIHLTTLDHKLEVKMILNNI